MAEFISLISGSSGNSSLVTDGKTHILIDCGMSGKRLAELLADEGIPPSGIDALLVTHEHIDHVKGAGIIARRYNIPIYATEKTHAAMEIGSVSDSLRRIVSAGGEFEIGTIGVRPFSIPHDAADPVGYSLFCGNQKFSLATDIGEMNGDIINAVSGSEAVILESNHDVEMLKFGSYPFPLKQRILSGMGHLSNISAARTALELAKRGTKKIMLGHLSAENNSPEIAMLETYNALTEAGVDVGVDVTLCVAGRYGTTRFGEPS